MVNSIYEKIWSWDEHKFDSELLLKHKLKLIFKTNLDNTSLVNCRVVNTCLKSD